MSQPVAPISPVTGLPLPMSSSLPFSLPRHAVGSASVLNMPNVDLEGIMRHLANDDTRRTWPLWQEEESLAFIARGREYRSEFHINHSHEFQYSLRGDLYLHYRTPEGREQVAHVPEGSCLYQPPLVPHSPRFGPDAFQLVIERKRRPGEVDKFHWFCQKCDAFLHEETFVVSDYMTDPVSRAYERFFTSEAFRTCGHCGTVMPAPDAFKAKAA